MITSRKNNRLYYGKGGQILMEQSSNTVKKEAEEMMNVEEVARMIEWLRAAGMSDTEINNCVTYIATGVGLPSTESEKEKSK